MPAWAVQADRLVLAVRVTPRSARDRLEPGTDAHWIARLTAPPVEGAANTALVALVAKAFDVPRRDVTIVSGATARLKRVAITGDANALARIASSLYGDAHDG